MEIFNPLPCTDSAMHYCDALHITALPGRYFIDDIKNAFRTIQ